MKALLVCLQGSGHTLYVASDGLDGLKLVERERPDLVLTDVAMPRLNGYELVDAIHGRSDLHQVRIILLSASAQRTELEEGYRHGVADYIVKPFTVVDLRRRVERVLNDGVSG
jgi:CheY-like chemotaxis protein